MNAKHEIKKEDHFLELSQITKTFDQFVALDKITMSIKKGEFICILGPSGCGKTTLLRVIAGLEQQNEGRIFLQGKDVSQEPVSKRNLGIVFQSYALFPNISVIGNVMYGIKNGFSGSQRKEHARQMLELVGLSDQSEKFPAQLSGGQQQRVALARALAPKPELLLLDEPLSALDARVRLRLRKEIRKIQETLGVTTVMVTHDQEEALTMADRVAVIKDGRLLQFAPPRELYKSPRDSFVASFIGSMNFISDCRFKSSDAVMVGRYPIKTIRGAAANYQNGSFKIAVRPEDIRIIRNNMDKTENVIHTKINDIEFRGSLYRIYLQVLQHNGESSRQTLEMDLQAEAVEEMKLSHNMELPIHIPPQKLLIFNHHGTG